MKRKSRFWLLAFAFLVIGTVHPQNRGTLKHAKTPGKHSVAITVLLSDSSGRIISAGEDGFLGIWDDGAAEGRFRVSRYAITSMAARPGIPEIAVASGVGRSRSSVSVWNYKTKERLFALRLEDPVTCVNYSAAGSFLIVSGSGGTILLDPETGEALKSPELPLSATLALTGPSERTVAFYLPSGVLSYWNLETENETQRFDVPPDIRNPVLFGNNCFLAGFDSGGLLVLDAVTGLVLAREPDIMWGDIFTENAESARFYCVSGIGLRCAVYLMEINLSGVLTTISRRMFLMGAVNRSISAGGGNIVLGTRLGDLWLIGEDETRVLGTPNRRSFTRTAKPRRHRENLRGKNTRLSP